MTEFILEQKPILLSAFGRSDQGRVRADNQDDFLIVDLSQPDGLGYTLRPELCNDSPASGHFRLGAQGALVLVADGMGGGGGSVASRLATTWIHRNLVHAWGPQSDRTPARFAVLLRYAIEEANARLHEQSTGNADLRGMGTTTTAVGVLGGYLYLGQVGDSRAYLVRGGTAIQLTRDQSMVQALVEAGAMSEDEAAASVHNTTILQAVGTGPSVAVDMTYQETRRGDTLLLCSDGLYRVVPREELADVVSRTDDLVQVCDTLIDLANQRGGPDNVTVVVARLDGDGLDSPAGGEVVRRNVMSLPES